MSKQLREAREHFRKTGGSGKENTDKLLEAIVEKLLIGQDEAEPERVKTKK